MIRTRTPGLAAWAVAFALAAIQGDAQAAATGALQITRPWIRATPDGAPTAAGYLTVTNRGRAPERLLGGSTPDAASIEPHSMSMAGGVMRMRLLPQGFDIAPGATVTLAPGGGHLMLVGPKRPLRIGDRVPATLKFAHAGAVKVEFAVMADAPKDTPAMPGMKRRQKL